MTDARNPDSYLSDRRVQRLRRRPEWWSYSMLVLWSVHHRTDGVIDLADIEDGLIPGVVMEDLPLICKVGLLTDGPDRTVFLVDFPATQTSRVQLEAAEAAREAERAGARERKRRQRDKAPGDVTRDVTRESRPKKQDRTGQAGSYGTGTNNGDGERVDDWPAVTEPGSAGSSDPGLCRRCGDPLPRGLVQLGRTEHIDRCAA